MPEYNLIWLSAVHVLVLLLSGLGYVESGSDYHLWCYKCDHVTQLNDCQVSKCGPGKMCTSEVHVHGPNHDIVEFSLNCKDANVCPGHPGYTLQIVNSIIGKKRGKNNHNSTDVYNLVCDECCNSESLCNAHLCAGSINGTTTVAPTTVVTTTVPSTTTMTSAVTPSPAPVYDPDCRDREEDGFACPMLDLFNLCSDSSTLSYVIAHEKCKRHCGLCTPDPNAPVIHAATPPPRGVCANYEQDGIKCAIMDLFKFCTDPSSIAYVLAHQKCPEHCGFCSSAAHRTTTTASTIKTTTAPTTPPTTTPVPPTRTVTMTTQSSCRDHEEDGFSCTAYDDFNFCTDTTGVAYSIAHTKCQKHCGFCGENATTAMPTTTVMPTTTTMPMVTATSKAMSKVQATAPQGHCEDREDATFKCTDNSNLCTATDFNIRLLAIDRCPKFCGLCGQSM